ncbi:sensor histidine kinase [Planctomonas psychrotolerans]|uniref:sensor histidine kinase n=1 Tax=Planctomonas psychrotolerans TaxID=2528712 RepID=UPI001D0D19AC|nr:ATP-binding protein [Planctomonas psychrotolerans]
MFGVVALLAIVGLVVGSVSVLALNSFLVSQVDTQLTAAVQRSGDAFGRPPGGGIGSGGNGPEGSVVPLDRLLPGLGAGALGVFESDGAVVQAGYLSVDGAPLILTEEQRSTVLGVDAGVPETVQLGGTLGEYRLLARDSGAGIVTIVGLPLREVTSITGNLAGIIALVTGLGLVAAAIAGAFVVRMALRPLERVVGIATRVSEEPLDRGDVALTDRVPAADSDSSTEVGKVGAALNRLLDHVGSALASRERSETRVRQFVADASHELRTPLAAIRGYAELTRRAPFVLPDDVTHSLSRIESESVRMTRLVEDLLLLARLDESRGGTAEPVDLGRLLVDVTGDARAAAPEHEWRLEVPLEPVSVPGDATRLHQVIANLLANARTHTPPGTRVTAALAMTDSQAVLSVEDNGPGIPADLHGTLFERFVRGDSSRSRNTGSTGLGLAIVRAIVEAHGGEVAVRSHPGSTRFEVRLPLHRALPATPEGRAVPAG